MKKIIMAGTLLTTNLLCGANYYVADSGSSLNNMPQESQNRQMSGGGTYQNQGYNQNPGYSDQNNPTYQQGNQNYPYQNNQGNSPYQNQPGYNQNPNQRNYQNQGTQGGGNQDPYQSQQTGRTNGQGIIGDNYNNRPNTSAYDYRAETDKNSSIPDNQLDKKIQDQIKGGYFSKGFENVNYQVRNGRVTLTGTVEKESDRKDIMEKIAKIDGVNAIDNQVTVKPKSSNK